MNITVYTWACPCGHKTAVANKDGVTIVCADCLGTYRMSDGQLAEEQIEYAFGNLLGD